MHANGQRTQRGREQGRKRPLPPYRLHSTVRSRTITASVDMGIIRFFVSFIPQPVLTLPGTSMRGYLAPCTLASTIRIPSHPAPCSYVGIATVLLSPPHPGDWTETPLRVPSRSAWQSGVGRGKRQPVSRVQQYTSVLLWYFFVLLSAVCESVVFQLRVGAW